MQASATCLILSVRSDSIKREPFSTACLSGIACIDRISAAQPPSARPAKGVRSNCQWLKGETMSISGAPGSIENQGGPPPRRRHPVQRWLLHVVAVLHRWADSGRARSASATWGFVQTSIIAGPPDALIIPLGLADPNRVFSFAFWTTVGSFFGALSVFSIGVLAFERFGIPLFSLIGVGTDTIQHAREMFAEHALLVVLVGSLGLLGIPANVMSIASGGLGVPLFLFAPVFLFGRSTRYFAVALIIRFAGTKLVGWIERRTGRPFATLR